MDYGYGHDLLDMTFKAQTNKKSINYKIFGFLCTNRHYQCRNRHPTEWGRLVSYVSATRSAPLVEEVRHSTSLLWILLTICCQSTNSSINNSVQEWAKGRSRNISKEDKQMTVNHVEGGSDSRETQGKATSCHFAYFRSATTKKTRW